MTILAVAVLIAWFIYSVKIALGLIVLCGFVAVFYGAAFEGPADKKVWRVFSVLVLVLSVVMVGAINSSESDAPVKLCGRVEC